MQNHAPAQGFLRNKPQIPGRIRCCLIENGRGYAFDLLLPNDVGIEIQLGRLSKRVPAHEKKHE
jgi:hypothetical protein